LAICRIVIIIISVAFTKPGQSLIFSDISFTAIFAEVTEHECIIDEHVRYIDTVHFAFQQSKCLLQCMVAPYVRAMLDARSICSS